MKKTYIQPSTLTVEMQHNQIIAMSIGGNAGFDPTPQPGDGTGPSTPQVKEKNIWDDEW
ncbi:MAG: hypothetical protein IJK51_00275 [Bacteroidaceae bacterium]|nr:hypothetical protein [Bacteroidaceae bacterium]